MRRSYIASPADSCYQGWFGGHQRRLLTLVAYFFPTLMSASLVPAAGASANSTALACGSSGVAFALSPRLVVNYNP
jgi:hypothetical protein